ncbi:response regulator transcription factor [Chitinophaga pendula]|uniref:response regulator transcription factor n=1 Tax=Chitinophaga TaxID=79328 RepID=UPI000BAFEFE2|nr:MULTISPECIES: response regulator transcription factor [Chitinophaga]ASZ12676.1 DNA-binding response regulator [Chitinophaga sp. MD30]UCJ09714.1 response regulator transcription factor [Chitinophaga pendula]
MLSQKKEVALAIVDDHPVVLQGLQSLLEHERHLHVTGCFTTGTDFLNFLPDNVVDIVLLDITLPDVNGMDLCKKIKSIAADTAVLVLSNHSERSIVMQMLQNGASGYLLKNAPAGELLSCIQEVLNGQVAFSNAVKEILAKPGSTALKSLPRLTRREHEILQLIADGQTTADIANHLFLSPLTVETHRRNLLQKFEAKNVATLIKIAVQQGFL